MYRLIFKEKFINLKTSEEEIISKPLKSLEENEILKFHTKENANAYLESNFDSNICNHWQINYREISNDFISYFKIEIES